MVLAVVVAVPAPAPGVEARVAYIVELAGPPLVVSDGVPGEQRARLDAAEDEVRRRAGIGAAPVIYRYRVALNGFAARLTAGEAARLRTDPGVLRVTADRIRTTDAGPDDAGRPAAASSGAPRVPGDGVAFLGLRDGLWARLGGPDHAGEGVVVGFLDTGVHPEHPSFADPGLSPPGGWAGTCQEGEAFPASACTGKLVAARWFADGFGRGRVAEEDFLSARDSAGHGSHVAATAVGNAGVVPDVDGGDLGMGATSGVAPRAQLSVYKVCWTGRDDLAPPVPSGCADSDSLAAVDAAVADGVDVLNLSLSTESSAYGPLDSALLNAVGAGVFVSTSAGNRGPAPGSVGAPGDAPWVTSVAATSLPRMFVATATVSTPGQEPLSVTGASVTGALSRAALVDGAAVAAAGVAPEQAGLCLAGGLDPGAVAGRAVFCRRGENARVEKSAAVAAAGGVGMVLANAADDEETSPDHHSIPTVHLNRADGSAVAARLGGGGVEVSLEAGRAAPAPADLLGLFSSRGPQAAVPDIPKPDLAAPGVTVLSATAPQGLKGRVFAVKSGTSMAAGHVAGAAALLTQLHPDWSPTARKSALMTTASTEVKEPGGGAAGPFATGSGRIDPNRAAEPGLVLEVSPADYARYLEGVQPGAVPGQSQPIAASDLNLPAVSYAHLIGAALTRRSFTSVDEAAGTWRVKVEGLTGMAVAALPPVLTLAPGQSGDVQLAFVHAGAPFDTYVTGALVLTHEGDGRTIRLPVSIRPVREPPGRPGPPLPGSGGDPES
jgi:subtilisin family serine protease